MRIFDGKDKDIGTRIHHSPQGPSFGYFELSLKGEPMNRPGTGECSTLAYYNIPEDSKGNSVLTGEGAG